MKTARERLLSCTLKRVRVRLPEYRLDLYVQEMDAGQRADYYSILTNAAAGTQQQDDISAKILLPSLLNLDGTRMLADDDLEGLTKLSPQVVTKLTNSLLEISGLLPAFYNREKKRLKSQANTSSFSSWLGNLVSRFTK